MVKEQVLYRFSILGIPCIILTVSYIHLRMLIVGLPAALEFQIAASVASITKHVTFIGVHVLSTGNRT